MMSDHEHPADDAFQARMSEVISAAGGITALSRMCTLSKGVLHKYANGASEPSRSRLIQIARAAGVSVEWLATGEGPMRRPPPGAVASPPAASASATTSGMNKDLIRDCIIGTEMYLQETNRYLQPDKKAQLIIALYYMIEEKQLNEKLTNTPSDRSAIIDRLFELAS